MEEFCGEVGMIGRIFVSARKGDITAIESFLERGGDVNASDRVNYCTLLDHACSTGNIDIAKLLLDRGALIKQNKFDETALHFAAHLGHADVISLLKERGGDIDIQNQMGDSPLHFACRSKQPSAVTVLIELGADVNLQNKDGDTPLHCLMDEHGISSIRSQICAFILERGGNPHSENKFGDTLLHFACRCSDSEIVNMLLSRGVSVHGKNGYGFTPLFHACKFGTLEMALQLIDLGADIKGFDNSGGSLLHSACRRGHLELVSLCLQKGIEVNHLDKCGITPLQSSDWENSQLLSLLIESGANHTLHNITDKYKLECQMNKLLKIGWSAERLNTFQHYHRYRRPLLQFHYSVDASAMGCSPNTFALKILQSSDLVRYVAEHF